MNIGIVSTWFERGAAYVSKQYMEILQKRHNVYIFARSGELYAQGDPKWDFPNVYWSKRINSPFVVTAIDKKEFVNWIITRKIDAILFNEQHWWYPLIWCKELNIKTIAYIDYYTEQTVPLFGIYDFLICNTKKHFKAFEWHQGARYVPWGTNLSLYNNQNGPQDLEKVVFFHSCGFDPVRKGTDLLLRALSYLTENDYKLIIHTQKDILISHPTLKEHINQLILYNKLEIIEKTVSAPGLYLLGDVYVYPSRLEGIGLTISEAISSGLCVIVPDCDPMNEFVHSDFGQVVKIERLYSRYDGYYWPQNNVDIKDLAVKMDWFIRERKNIKQMKLKAREYAVKYLDWDKNAIKVLDIVEEELQRDDKMVEDALQKIIQFEKHGIRKYNVLFMKNKKIMSFIKRLFKQ